MYNEIIIKGARENNLKSIDINIPKNKLIVLTGLSGSGKSSLAYDTLQKECQRQYMESMGMVTDAVSKPKVDSISGLSPSISVDQHQTNRSPRSTVGTATEVYTYLRVLFARLGERDCPKCGSRVNPILDPKEDIKELLFDEEACDGGIRCPNCNEIVPELSMSNFSFNKPQGACEVCTGLGSIYEADWDSLIDDEKSIVEGAVREWDIYYINRNRETLTAAGKHYGFEFDLDKPVKLLSQVEKDLLFYGIYHEKFKKHFPSIEPPETARTGRFEGVASNILRRYAEHSDNESYREKIAKSLIIKECPSCNGKRINKYSRRVTVGGKSIVELAEMSLKDLLEWLIVTRQKLSEEAGIIAAPIFNDLEERIKRLVEVGIGYLTMNRGMTTLSGGETQRIRLASLLGSGLTGVLYVLDEPTTGLHSRDTEKLLQVLKRLRDMGNTILVIEHDIDMILEADFVIDMGPGAGKDGGSIIATGSPVDIIENPCSVTGRFLKQQFNNKVVSRRRAADGYIEIKGAAEHNLKNIDVSIPLKNFVTVTGVSGSGKSTIIFDILDRVLSNKINGSRVEPGSYNSISGLEYIDRIVTVDQSPIGRVPRSNAATYTEVFTPIRSLFASLPQAKEKGITARDLSFNVPGGRCDKCEGAGVLNIGMHFLPDVEITCPVCKGKRFKKHILSLQYHNKNISEVLDMSIAEAYELFKDKREIASKLKVLVDVGMGYLKLGQPATTFSGGEAQRVKLAKELGRTGKGHTLYLLDEPTTGLHSQDVYRLEKLLQNLVNAGNTVCVVEHNLDLIFHADWIIDMGPEGGEKGGTVIAKGTPEDIIDNSNSYTGRCLKGRFNKM